MRHKKQINYCFISLQDSFESFNATSNEWNIWSWAIFTHRKMFHNTVWITLILYSWRPRALIWVSGWSSDIYSLSHRAPSLSQCCDVEMGPSVVNGVSVFEWERACVSGRVGGCGWVETRRIDGANVGVVSSDTPPESLCGRECVSQQQRVRLTSGERPVSLQYSQWTVPKLSCQTSPKGNIYTYMHTYYNIQILSYKTCLGHILPLNQKKGIIYYILFDYIWENKAMTLHFFHIFY